MTFNNEIAQGVYASGIPLTVAGARIFVHTMRIRALIVIPTPYTESSISRVIKFRFHL